MKFFARLLIVALTLTPFSLTFAAETEAGVSSAKFTDDSNPRLQDRFLVRISEPHWLTYSEVNIEALVRIGSHFAVGPTFGYMNGDDSIHWAGKTYDYYAYNDENTRIQYGVKAAYYFNHVNATGGYVSAFGRQAETTVKRTTNEDYVSLLGNETGKAEFSEFIYGATGGYQWQIGRMRVHVGGGYQFYNSPGSVTVKYDGSNDVARVADEPEKSSIVIDGGIGLTF